MLSVRDTIESDNYYQPPQNMHDVRQSGACLVVGDGFSMQVLLLTSLDEDGNNNQGHC